MKFSTVLGLALSCLGIVVMVSAIRPAALYIGAGLSALGVLALLGRLMARK